MLQRKSSGGSIMYSWKNVIPSIETNNFCLHNYGDSKVRATYEA